MRRSLILAIIGTAVVMLAGSALAQGGQRAQGTLPTLLGSWVKGPSKLLVRPAEIIYTGDGTGILGGFDGAKGKGFGHLTWTRWTSGSAFGHGADWIDDCQPDCAGGTYTAHKAIVNAFRPRDGRFTRLTITSSYRGKPLVSHLQLKRESGNFFYAL